MNVRKAALVVAGLVGLLALPIPASSDPGTGTLFGTDGTNGNLIRVDPATGAGTVVGPLGPGSVPSLAVDPTTGTMYTGEGAGNPNLYTVDPSTGAATLVGDTGLGLAAVGGLDFRADGQLFAAVNLAGDGGTGSDHLALINKATAAANVVGPFGTCTGVTIPSSGGGSCTIEGIEGIAFDPSGKLWGVLSARGAAGQPGLYRIDPSTGAATFVAQLLDGSGAPASGGFVSIQFSCEGTLYGGTARAMAPATDGGRLATIDPTTGRFTFVGSGSAAAGTSLAALAFGNRCDPPPGPHFQCYKGRFEPRFKKRGIVLTDQFQETQAKAVRPRLFCNPVDKTYQGTKSGIPNKNFHLKNYRITQTAAFNPMRVVVNNQFGLQTMDVVSPSSLMVPTQKRPFKKPQGLDHYKCYGVSGGAIDQPVGLRDQFLKRQTSVLSPVLLCTPVEKKFKKKTTQIVDPLLHEVCYKTEPTRFKRQKRPVVRLKNQFGRELFQARKAVLLCVPSRKSVL